MKKSEIAVTSHSGKEDLNKLINRLVLVKIIDDSSLKKRYDNDIHATTIHSEKLR